MAWRAPPSFFLQKTQPFPLGAFFLDSVVGAVASPSSTRSAFMSSGSSLGLESLLSIESFSSSSLPFAGCIQSPNLYLLVSLAAVSHMSIGKNKRTTSARHASAVLAKARYACWPIDTTSSMRIVIFVWVNNLWTVK
jgi:hypothetical protein